MHSYDELLSRILSRIGEDKRAEIEEAVERLITEDPRLTRLGALFIIADEQGVFNESVQPEYFIPISKLVGGLSSVNVKVRVIGISGPVGWDDAEMTYLRLGDASGVVSGIAWREASEQLRSKGIGLGDVVVIRNGYTRERIDGGVELHLGRSAEVTKTGGEELPDLSSFFQPLDRAVGMQGEVDLKAEVLAVADKRGVTIRGRVAAVRDALLGWGSVTAPFVAWRHSADSLSGEMVGRVAYISSAKIERGAVSSISRTCIHVAEGEEPIRRGFALKVLDVISSSGEHDEYIAASRRAVMHLLGRGLRPGMVIEPHRYEFVQRHGRWMVRVHEYSELRDEGGWPSCLVPLSEIREGMVDICARGVVSSKAPLSRVRTRRGEVESVTFWLREGANAVFCRAWTRHAELVDGIPEGSRAELRWVRARRSRGGEVELQIDGYAKIVTGEGIG